MRNDNDLQRYLRRCEIRRNIIEWCITSVILVAALTGAVFAITEYAAWKGF